MTKEEIELFKKEFKDDFRNEVKRQNNWIKANTLIGLSFIAILIYLLNQISGIKSDYLTKSEYEIGNQEFKQELAEKYGLNIQLSNVLAKQIKALLIEKDMIKYEKLVDEENSLTKEKDAISFTIKKREAKSKNER